MIIKKDTANYIWFALVLAVIIFVFLTLTQKLPFIKSYTQSLIVLVVLGVVMYTFAILGGEVKIGNSFYFLLLVGIFVVYIFISAVLGRRIPYIGGEREVFLTLSAIFSVFFLIHLYRLLFK